MVQGNSFWCKFPLKVYVYFWLLTFIRLKLTVSEITLIDNTEVEEDEPELYGSYNTEVEEDEPELYGSDNTEVEEEPEL